MVSRIPRKKESKTALHFAQLGDVSGFVQSISENWLPNIFAHAELQGSARDLGALLLLGSAVDSGCAFNEDDINGALVRLGRRLHQWTLNNQATVLRWGVPIDGCAMVRMGRAAQAGEPHQHQRCGQAHAHLFVGGRVGLPATRGETPEGHGAHGQAWGGPGL